MRKRKREIHLFAAFEMDGAGSQCQSLLLRSLSSSLVYFPIFVKKRRRTELPKLCPVKKEKQRFDSSDPNPRNPKALSDLPGVDIFVSTADAEKEPPLVTANTILSILAVDYSVEKVACYVSDDGGSLVTFEALAEAASFAKSWVPFCHKHDIEPLSRGVFWA